MASKFASFNLYGKNNTGNEKSTVWEIEPITEDKIKSLFEALGGIQNLIQKDLARSTVLIKPNICLPLKSESGSVTSTNTIEILCRVLISYGIKRVIIADHTLQDTGKFKDIELWELENKYPGVKLLLADEERLYMPVEVDGKVLKKTDVMKIINKADLFINIANAKHHSATHVSLAVKNLMGCIWNRSDFHTKMYLHQAIGDLAMAVKPHLNIIDANYVLLTGGPVGPGNVINDKRMFASCDILALDSVVLSRYNFGGKSISPQEVAHLSASYQNGIGEIDIEKINIFRI